MIRRDITSKIRELFKSFPIVSVTGPRQAGKTTLLRHLFPDKAYMSLEDPDIRLLALNDPRAFLNRFPDGALLDEIQRIPDLFSYLQSIVDESGQNGLFVLSGSQSFLLHDKISQSLAGRTAIMKLLPFNLNELKHTDSANAELNHILFTGGYPRIYDKKISPQDFFPNYIQTYIERDVRSLQNIQNLDTFSRFLKFVAGRVGKLLNMNSLANDCGITVNTVKAWLSILEASYIITFLRPHYANYNKRLIKAPKLYFYDTGLVCYLLGIEKAEQLETHYLRGELFENFVISELIKYRYNLGRSPNIYFWQDHKGLEIDCLIEKSDRLIAIEIKSGVTVSLDYFKNQLHWNKISGTKPDNNFVVYAGDSSHSLHDGNLVGWRKIDEFLPEWYG